MSLLTDKDIVKIVTIASELSIEYPHLRYGQCFYNALYDLYPEAASYVVTKDWDPFYDDTKVPQCITFLLNDD